MLPSHQRYAMFRPEKCSRDSDERGDGSQRINSVMPRVCFNRGALGLSSEPNDIPKENFLNDDSDNENGEREWCGSVMGRQNFANTFNGKTIAAARTPSATTIAAIGSALP